MHMELSKLGIVPKLLDFIRVSNDDGQLQILGKGLVWCVEPIIMQIYLFVIFRTNLFLQESADKL